jgi:hypothetical protein
MKDDNATIIKSCVMYKEIEYNEQIHLKYKNHTLKINDYIFVFIKPFAIEDADIENNIAVIK